MKKVLSLRGHCAKSIEAAIADEPIKKNLAENTTMQRQFVDLKFITMCFGIYFLKLPKHVKSVT